MTEVERISDLNEIVFPRLGFHFNIDPTAFTIGGFAIQWYGIIITLGLLLAVVYCVPRMKRFGLDPDRAIDVVIGGVIGGIVGARVYYVIWKWDEYSGNIKEIFNTRNGGLAIYGGLIGAVLVGLLICKIRRVKMLPMLDIAVIGFLIGQGIGRWGNFVNQEAFGTNTGNIFGMTGGRIQQTIINSSAYLDGEMYLKGIEISENYPVHPCFLYESAWCLLGFVLLAFWSKRRKYDGQLFLMYMTWYGAERFFVEGLRTDSLMLGSIRVSQLLSAILVIVSVIMQIVMLSRRKRDPESYVLYANTAEARQLLEESRLKHNGMNDDGGADSDDEIGILPDEPEDGEESAPDSKVQPEAEEKPEAAEEPAEKNAAEEPESTGDTEE